MAARIHGTRHARLTRVGDLLDLAADWVITAGVWIAVFALGALWGVALFAAVLNRLGVWQ
jgi:phosphatidylglycerophosphate synthase